MTSKAHRAIAESLENAIAHTQGDHAVGQSTEAARENPRLVEEREAKLRALRATIEASIAASGEVSDDELDAALNETFARLEREGVGA